MAHIPDLDSRTYSSGCSPRAVSVGWLSDKHEFTKGAVPEGFLDKLKLLRRNNGGNFNYRGSHTCEFCDEGVLYETTPEGGQRYTGIGHNTGETHLYSDGTVGPVYVAPMMISHYVEVHGYKPPDEFIEAVMAHG